jgi:hypothetical protein
VKLRGIVGLRVLLAASSSVVACSEEARESQDAGAAQGSDEGAASSVIPFEPCAEKACGDDCTLCAPGDDDCISPAEPLACDHEGKCGEPYNAECE